MAANNMVGNATPQPPTDIRAANNMLRSIVLNSAVNAWLPIATGTVTTGAGTVINVPVRNVGFIKRFVIELACTYTNGIGGTLTLTSLGASNMLSNVLFTDLSNQQRINTTGWHLYAVSTAKNRRPWASATTTDNPCGYGNNFTKVWSAPATIGASGNGTLYGTYEVPVSYSDTDLRGAIWANVVNATMNLQFTLNPNFVAGSTANPTLAVYQGATNINLGTLTSVTYTVYQNYLDQIPVSPKTGPMLPVLDMSTAYMLMNTAVSGLVVNQDNNVAYANFRDFLSTTVVYDNNGVLNTGSDINYMSIQTANFSNLVKLDPNMIAMMARVRNGDDFPKGTYYFDHRDKPINTVQYGNMGLIANLSAVSANASLLIGYEQMALMNQVVQAGSLAST